jgi:2-succinyl-5-enolpyruvyl-6-hydroxy-3-cyclohexene-1-carboxylate synthase
MPSRTPETPAPGSARGGPSRGGAASGADTPILNVRWATALIGALVAGGVRDAVVAPGSRSAPLALALDRSGIRLHVALDERAGSYFALGLAKASRRPVAIVTTSGTAAANLHPAALEAFHGRVPLVLLTADRPPELRGTGAPQTIDQIELFGSGVRWFCEVGAPAPGEEARRYAASIGARAARVAAGPPAGPVHLNLAFREPLVPDPETLEAIAPRRLQAAAEDAGAAAEWAALSERVAPPPAHVARVAQALRGRRRGLLVCGPEDARPDFADAIARLAEATGYPVLADPLSSLRYGPHDRSAICGAYDLFLRAPGFAGREAPELILQFGATPTSKAYQLYAARHETALRIAVDEAGAWRDPSRRLHEVVAADPALFAAALADALRTGSEPLPSWRASFERAERAARGAIERHVAAATSLGEESVFPALLRALPEGGILYAGNSMIVRDLDATAPGGAKRIRVLGNRGVNGIDGVVSSALGASAAGVAPLLAVVGDLSFHHDLTSLAALREGRARAAIVVVNNDGGGIFSFLPVAEHGGSFERLFATPHGLDVARAAALYGVPYARATTGEELAERAAASLRSGATTILEVRTERGANREAHRALADAAIGAVEERT